MARSRESPGFLLHRLGVEEDVLHGVVQRAADEADVAAWLREHTDASDYPSINETLRRVRPKHAQDPEYFAQIYAPTLALHPELEQFSTSSTPTTGASLERYRKVCKF